AFHDRNTAALADGAETLAALAEARRWSPGSSLVLIGFSLGGNIVLKVAGEASDAHVPGLGAVAAVAPPIDLERCSALISNPGNRWYERFIVRNLLEQVRRHQRYFADVPRVAPRGGFADALDYYRRASALPLLARIAVPTLILTASDDPL